MKSTLFFYAIILVAMVLMSAAATAQVANGGTFSLEQSVIAGGGTTNSTGGNFKIEGTIGQAAAGTRSTVVPFQMQNGFWTAIPLAPTAASVSISGRVMTADGRGIKKAIVVLTKPTGERISALTGAFGYYRFDGVMAGQTYIVEVNSKRFHFSPQVVSVMEDLANLDFTAQPVGMQN